MGKVMSWWEVDEAGVVRIIRDPVVTWAELQEEAARAGEEEEG